MQYNFEWDPRRVKASITKHDVSFEQAAEVFLDSLHIVIFDEEHSEAEERWVTIGKTGMEEEYGTPRCSQIIMDVLVFVRLFTRPTASVTYDDE